MRETSNSRSSACHQHSTSNNQGRLSALRSEATRRICVGTVYRDGHLVQHGQLRSHKCLSVQWRGMTNWCQPWQFGDDRELWAAVSHRLRLAGLRLVALAVAENKRVYEPIVCEVRRLRVPHERVVALNRMWQEWAEPRLALAFGGRESQ